MSHRTCAHSYTRPSPRPFALPGDSPQYARDRSFGVEEMALNVRLDLDRKQVDGDATLTLRRVDPAARYAVLDAIAFELHAVERLDGDASRGAAYAYDGETLRVDLSDVPDGGVARVRVGWTCMPRRGLYFLGPDPDVRDRPRQVWSQGQDQDNRNWFPCQDHPNQRMRTEVWATVPSGMFALSNGTLVDRAPGDDGTETFHWRQQEPHASYLVTLVVGEFDESHGEAAGVPLSFYVPRGSGVHVERSLGRTAEMVRVFVDKLKTPFPWEKYAQVVVSDFIFGGMENTSATTLYDRVLVDERASIDTDVDALVSHELAHQWFGNLVTCRDWSHAWLNEGFATFFEHVWREHKEGLDAYLYGLEQDHDSYLAEERDRYRRPIVTNVWNAPLDLFDRHLYQKGGLTLHTLRRELGEDVFWRGVRLYLARHRGRSVETRDFCRAMEDATGRSLEAFFDQWVLRAGHPALEVTAEHADGLLQITVRQAQGSDGDASSLWTFELPVEVTTASGTSRHRLTVRRQVETFALPCPTDPQLVVVDPELSVVGTVDLRLGTALVCAQLERGRTALARWRAARALGKRNDARALGALAKGLLSDGFWGVRAECALALGEHRTGAALDALERGASDADARVRRAVARALGDSRTTRAADALLEQLRSEDRSYHVEAERLRSLGRTRDPRAFEVLVGATRRDSWADIVRAGALDGLASLRDPRAVPVLVDFSRYGQSQGARRASLGGLARVRETTSDKPVLFGVREGLVRCLDGFDPYVKVDAIRALVELGDAAVVADLERAARFDLDGRVRRRAREAARELAERLSSGREAAALRDEIAQLRDEMSSLRDKVAGVEARAAKGPVAS